MTDTLLTERALSERFGVSPRTLQRWRRTGEGPRFIRAGARCVRYAEAEVIRWEARNSYDHRAAELAKAES
ncbi:helix-turn-helix transcriptional regulator [Roseomonas xinghualingensis]